MYNIHNIYLIYIGRYLFSHSQVYQKTLVERVHQKFHIGN